MKLRKSLALITVILFVLLSISSITGQEKGNPNEPIKNLQFQSADINSVLTFLAEYGGVNVVVSPDVEGSVTIKLKDVKWRIAMDIIGKTYNLAVINERAGYIRVLPAEDYRKEVSERERHKAEQRTLVALDTRIVKIANSTSKGISTAVSSLLSERGKASSDDRSNSVIIQDVPGNIEKVVSFIKELDKPSPQIRISAKLLEINDGTKEELGILWKAMGAHTTASGRSYSSSGAVTEKPADSSGTFTFSALQHGWSVDAVVQAIVSESKGRILAHPEITTLDNHEAKIQMGSKIPIKQFDASGNLVIKFEEVGTILTVTPHITADNQILMELAPERSTYEFDPNGIIINTSNARTTVIVNNGQTAVIGGLTTEDEVITVTGVPILKDIPLLGFLFRSTNTRIESRDLVIFVTPTIVDGNLAMVDSEN